MIPMTNEVLCEILCHNLVVLIHEMYELGIDPVFWESLTRKLAPRLHGTDWQDQECRRGKSTVL